MAFKSLAVLATAGIVASAQAAGTLVLIDAPPATDTLAFGASVWRIPTYPGATRSDTLALPGVDWYSSKGWFVSTDNGVGYNAAPAKDVQAGIRLWPQFGRSKSDAPAGLDRIGLRIQPQVFANAMLADVVLLQGALATGAGRKGRGSQLELGVTSGIPLDRTLIGIGVSRSWANAAFRDDYFGVSAAESQASGLAATRLGGGALDVAAALSLEHRFDERWRLSGQIVRSRFDHAVAASPVVQTRWQSQGTLTLWRAW